MPGLKETIDSISAKCPHCHRKLKMNEYVSELFSRIIELVGDGYTVKIPNFGAFSPKSIKEKTINHFNLKHIHIPARTIISFRAAKQAKERVNNAKPNSAAD